MLPHRITNLRISPQLLRRPLKPLNLLPRLIRARRQGKLLRLYFGLVRDDHTLGRGLRDLDGDFFDLGFGGVGGDVCGVAEPLAGEGDLGFVEFDAGLFFGFGDEGA